MTTFVALLRGVNVGKAKRVRMVELRALLTGLGYTGVATLLNSGNAVFRADKGTPAQHAAKITAAVATRLGVEAPVIVKSAAELKSILTGNPLVLSTADHSRLLVAFAQDARSLADLVAIRSLIAPPEQFAMCRHAAYLLCASGILGSRAGEALLGKAARTVTTRNWATVLKLQALVDNGGA